LRTAGRSAKLYYFAVFNKSANRSAPSGAFGIPAYGMRLFGTDYCGSARRVSSVSGVQMDAAALRFKAVNNSSAVTRKPECWLR
jgi:hypothetical protein